METSWIALEEMSPLKLNHKLALSLSWLVFDQFLSLEYPNVPAFLHVNNKKVKFDWNEGAAFFPRVLLS